MTIQIQQPQPYDLVGETILVSGNASAFEGQANITVGEGHDEYSALASVGSLSTRQFQTSITIPSGHAFRLNRLFVRLIDEGGAGDEAEAPSMTVPVLFGPMILPGYTGYWEHTVISGENLSAIARHYYEGDVSKWKVIQQANQHSVPDANIIHVGQILRIPRYF